MTITGGCLCGAVRYRIEVLPIAKRICWCRDCQFIGAGHGTVNLTFAGTLDDCEIARPLMTIWASSAPAWAPIDPRIPAIDMQPPPPAVPPKG